MINTVNDTDELTELEYATNDELLATMYSHVPPSAEFDSMSIDDILHAQLNDTFCAEIRHRFNKW